MTTGLVSVEGTLDRLQEQVEAGTCRIASACSRLENLIQSLCKDDMTRPFLSVMGRILNLLFGDDVRAGWIETAVDNDSLSALYHLLEPHGAVFSAAWHYSITEGVSHYELSTLAVLPVPMQKVLQKEGPKALPKPFDSNIVNFARDGAPLYVMRLDAAEYFVFRLLQVLLTFHRHRLGFGRSASGSRFFLTRSHSFESLTVKVGGGERSYRFQNDAAARLYHKLIQAYLNYFLPTSGTEESYAKTETIFATRFLRLASGTWTGWKIASFFFATINELWLHQQEYRIESTGHIESDPPFVLPSVDHFETLRVVTRHVITAACYPVRPAIPPAMQRFYEQLVEYPFFPGEPSHPLWSSSIFVDFRVNLYRLLRLGLAKCPSDSTITVVGGLWLDYVAPWRYLSVGHDREESTEAWKEFVSANYFFYHTLLSSLLDYSEVIVESFGDALSRHGSRIDLESTKTALLPLLLLVVKILAAISPFSELLARVEEEELLVVGRGWDVSSSLSASASLAASASASFIRRAPLEHHAIGAKEQLRALESERFNLLPLFDGSSKQRTMRILYWLERIFAALPDDGHAVDVHAADVSARRLFTLTPTPGNSHHEIELKSTIMQCEEELCAIFSITEDAFNEFGERFEEMRAEQGHESDRDHGNGHGRGRGRGHLAPHSKSSLRQRKFIPAPTPDERIARKRTVPHPKDPGQDRLIKSYEITLLVKLTGMLSAAVNQWYLWLLSRVEARIQRELPRFIQRHRFSFRFLAAVPNLCFLLLIYVLVRTLLPLVW